MFSIEKTKKRIDYLRKNSVLKNAMALFFLQFFNYLVPLLVYPYLTRTLSVDGFGLVMMSISFAGLSSIIIDYGFSLYGVYFVSLNRGDKCSIADILGSIIIIKLILYLVISLFVSLYLVNISDIEVTLYYIVYVLLAVFCMSFQLNWFYQGIEKMKRITQYTMASKLIYAFLVFVMVKSSDQVDTVVLLYAVSNGIALLIAFKGVYSNGYYIKLPSFKHVIETFRNSTQYFLSRAAVSVYTTASTLIVGAFAGVQQAAYYSACEKLYQAGQSATGPVNQALFPYLAKTRDVKFLLKVISMFFVPLLVSISIAYYYSDLILDVFFGSEYLEAASTLRIFLLICMVNFLAVNFGYPAFASLGKLHIANISVCIAAILQLSVLLVLYKTENISAKSVALSVLFVESFVAVLRMSLFYFYLKKKESCG